MNRAFGTVALALVLAGCGGGDPLAAALARSPLTYWHYRDPAWWGRDPHIRIALERRRGPWALVELQAPSGTQWVLLRRGRSWRVADQVSDHASRLSCGLAPAGVVRALAGSCVSYRAQWDLVILGPTSRRVATRAERHAIAPADCSAPVVYISRLDPVYAELDNCAASGGAYLVHRGVHGWREIGLEVDGFVCSTAPPGVIRSLHGRCLLAG